MSLEKIKGMKRLVYDMEVSPALGYFFPPFHRTNIIKMEQPQVLMSVSWSWVGDYQKTGTNELLIDESGNKVPLVHNVKLNDYPSRYKSKNTDDYEVTRVLHDLLGEADVVIGFNNINFDDKLSNYYFVKHGFPPPKPYRSVDLYAVAKSQMRNPSNSLDLIAQGLGYEGKNPKRQTGLWYDCLIKGSSYAWELMKSSNNQDVVSTLQIYEKYMPFIHNHPVASTYSGDKDTCDKCGKSGTFQSRGTKVRGGELVRWFWCNPLRGGCQGWSSRKLNNDGGLRDGR